VPVSVSIFFNVPGYDKNLFLFVIVNQKNQLKTLFSRYHKSKIINENKYSQIIKFLDAYINDNQNDLDKFKDKNGLSNIYDVKQIKVLVKLSKL
jgi:hypothetical protein